MPILRSPFVVGLVFLASTAGSAGCAYDWAVGAAALEGTDAGAPDATVEAAVTDATAPSDASSALDARAIDGATDAGPSDPCVSLRSRLDTARAAAKKCDDSTPNQCATEKITDECGCTSYVLDASSPQTTDFEAAVSAFADAGCSPSCADGGCSFQTIGSCLPSSKGYACFP